MSVLSFSVTLCGWFVYTTNCNKEGTSINRN